MTDIDIEQRKAQRHATLFDLRIFIGSLFVVFGALVTLAGATASEAEIAKATGIRLALWVGLAMLAVGATFVTWTLLAPPELTQPHELTEEDLPEQVRHTGLEDIPEHPGHPA